MTRLVMTPCRFDAAFPDGLLSIDGYAFSWRGFEFVVHERRELESDIDVIAHLICLAILSLANLGGKK